MEFQENQIRELEHSCKKRWAAIFRVLIPLSFSFLFDTLTFLLCLIYAGHLPVKNGIAVAGLSQSFCIMVIICFISGVGASADTLITQEYGSRNYDNCANYFNKMIVSTGFLIILFLPMVLYSGRLFIFIGVQQQLAYQSQDFLYIYYLAQIIYLENQNIKIMFRSQQLAWPSFVGSFISIIVFVIMMEIILNLVSSQLWIIPFSLIIANSAQFIFLSTLVCSCSFHTGGTVRCLKCSDLQNWRVFITIAFITLVIQIIQSYNGQIMNLVIATISSTILSAQNVLFSITVNLYFFIAFGISTTVAIFVGNFIGMKEINLARRFALESGITFSLFSIIVAAILALFSRGVITLFTNDERIIKEVFKGYYFMIAVLPLETINWVGVGILKGLGKIYWIPIQEIIIYYLIFQPFCYVFVKILGYGYQVYWIVYLLVSLSMITCNYSYLKCLSLQKIAQQIEERQIKEKQQGLRETNQLSQNLLQAQEK